LGEKDTEDIIKEAIASNGTNIHKIMERFQE
jgi:hypothetical protein